jgi:hypothetical protein
VTWDGELELDEPQGVALPEHVEQAVLQHKAALVAVAPPDWPPRPAELAFWPASWRERWGRLANELELNGTPFPRSEAEAFRRTRAEMPDALRQMIAACTAQETCEEDNLDDQYITDPTELEQPGWPQSARAPGQLCVPHGPRDFRRGDRWLPWHFNPDGSPK